jgi:hypothetical protein
LAEEDVDQVEGAIGIKHKQTVRVFYSQPVLLDALVDQYEIIKSEGDKSQAVPVSGGVSIICD